MVTLSRICCFHRCNTFADYYKVPVSGLQPIPEGMDLDLACLGAPIACAMYSAMTCGAQLGDVVVAVEAAGTEASMNQATAMLKHNGILALYSRITQPIRLNIGRWHDDGLEIRTTCLVHHTEQQRFVWTPWALRPVVQGLVDVRSLITHEFPLEKIAEAFAVADKDPTAIKVIVRN